ncbi:SDR family oxidoreductase [Croceibacterium ferulae]|uniref:SDR family oxidoreductase n=1 Tax=Croceibacterium ferulae TaxID=1854641 RepID=UPI000EB1BFC6|nr:SDR family oxidoreductase [Croceibacterium ferulae]
MNRWVPLSLLLVMLLLPGCAAPRLSGADQRLMLHRTFVVTGASSGFGRGVAERLGRGGANVVLAARRAEVLEEVAAEVRAGGGTALVVPTDVSDPAAVEALAQAAVTRFGRIDAWINNAGIGAIGRFEDIPMADHARVIDVNLKGVIYGSHAALRQFRTQGFGTLVNVSSVEGKIAVPYHASYAASKHAITGLGVALDQELRLARTPLIRVATVMPWASDTPYFTHTANYSGGTPRMVMFDDPGRVADTIVWAALHPRKEIAVGFKARAAITGHRLLPGVAEDFAGNVLHRVQVETAPPAPPTPGSLYQPMPEGTGVRGDVRERMEREDAAREAGRVETASPEPRP